MISGHGGNIAALARHLGCEAADIIDMSSNVNPLGPMPGLLRRLETSLSAITALPEVDADGVIEKFARRFQVDARRVLAGNGTTQLIYTVPLALGSRNALIVGPTYADYADACEMFGVRYDFLLTNAGTGFRADVRTLADKAQGCDTVFICNPNNPTGSLLAAKDLAWLFRRLPDTVFIIDESYMPFAATEDADSVLARGFANVVVLHSLSKIFRIPGLRIGFLVAPENLTARFRRFRLPWAVNSLALAAVDFVMTHSDRVTAFIEETRIFLATEKKHFEAGLSRASGLTAFPSATSFMLMKLPENLTAESVCDSLAQRKILIRNCSNFIGLGPGFIRVSLKTRECNQVVIDHLVELCGYSPLVSLHPGVRR
ncbi:MAG: threonine-phosphate decarboxylase [Desulfobacterales bacterium]